MLPGSREIGWRIDEAAPHDFAGVWGDCFPDSGMVASPVMEDLALLGHDVNYWDIHPMTRYSRTLAVDLPPNMDPPKPLPQLDVWKGHNEYDNLDDERVTFIGGGAGTIILASYFVGRGLPPENVTVVDPRGATGGIWSEVWARSGGFNNPKGLRFDDVHQLGLRNRDGRFMNRYLREIAGDFLGGMATVRTLAGDLRRETTGDREWVTTTADGRRLASESVVLATGRPHPRTLNGGRINSNLERMANSVPFHDLLVEHHQRPLTDRELGSGRPIVLIGLGNSTAAMLNQIHAYENRSGRQVNYRVLTDRSRYAINQPEDSFDGKPSIFRKPQQGYLTGYSGDLPRDRDAYYRALTERRIIPEVDRIHYRRVTNMLRVAGGYRSLDIARPHVFSLIGYEADKGLFYKAGALTIRKLLGGTVVKVVDQPDIRPSDGAVYTFDDGYMSNLYAAGGVAASSRNPNAAVIPGIQAQAPGTMLTIAVRNMVREQTRRRSGVTS